MSRDVTLRRATERKRAKVFKRARRKGHVTNAEAAEIGGWVQGFYHLNVLRHRGYLKRTGRNKWTPTRKLTYQPTI
jgi:hypothetical protein